MVGSGQKLPYVENTQVKEMVQDEYTRLYGIPLGDLEVNERICLFVKSRFGMMEEKKRWQAFKIQRCRELRDLGLTAYQEKNPYSKPYRSCTFDSLIDTWLDKYVENMPDWALKASTFRDAEAQEKATGIQIALQSIEEDTSSEEVKCQVMEDAFTSGTGVMYHWFNPALNNGRGNLEDCYVDVRDIYPDDAAISIDKCRDIVWREDIPWSTFQEIWGEYFDISLVQAGALTAEGDMKYYSKTEEQEQRNKLDFKARIYQYWNKELNIYCIIVNQWCIFATLFEDEELPFTFYYNKRRSDSIWGNGLIEKTAPEVFAIDVLVELAFKNAKSSLQKQIVADGAVGFHSGLKQAPNGIWIIPELGDKNVKDTFAEISLGGIPNEFFGMRTVFLDNLTTIAKIDLRQLLSSPNYQETATRTAAKKESFEEPVRSFMRRNLWRSERRRVQIKVQQFKDHIAPLNQDFHVEGFFVLKGDTDSPQFVKDTMGEGVFRANSKNTNVDVKVVVTSQQKKDLTDDQEVQKFLQFMKLSVESASISPEVAQKINFAGFLEQGADLFAIDKRQLIKGYEDKGFDAIQHDIEMLFAFEQPIIIPNFNDPMDYVDRFNDFRQYINIYKKKLTPKIFSLMNKHLADLRVKGAELIDRKRAEIEGQSQVGAEAIAGQPPMPGQVPGGPGAPAGAQVPGGPGAVPPPPVPGNPSGSNDPSMALSPDGGTTGQENRMVK